MPVWPDWWEWELEFIDHALERMVDRNFTETDLRDMLERASGYRKSRRPGRWVVETQVDGQDWEVVVEPDYSAKVLEVVTSYKVIK
jgi:hypothetical protein